MDRFYLDLSWQAVHDNEGSMKVKNALGNQIIFWGRINRYTLWTACVIIINNQTPPLGVTDCVVVHSDRLLPLNRSASPLFLRLELLHRFR